MYGDEELAWSVEWGLPVIGSLVPKATEVVGSDEIDKITKLSSRCRTDRITLSFQFNITVFIMQSD